MAASNEARAVLIKRLGVDGIDSRQHVQQQAGLSSCPYYTRDDPSDTHSESASILPTGYVAFKSV